MHRYMCAHPERIVDGCSSDPWRRDDEGNLVGDSHNAWNTEILNDVCPGGYSEQPREWTAKAGDVVIWHHWTVHNGSENVNARPRLGVFSRFHHSDWQEMRWDHGGILTDHDLWKWWTPEVKAAPVNSARPLDVARL